MDGQLQHDTAVGMARELLAIIANCLREEEHQDAFAEFYRVCHAGIARYCAQKPCLEAKNDLGSENP